MTDPAVTDLAVDGRADGLPPGDIRSPEREIVLSAGQVRQRITVVSRSSRPIRVSSHYPFWRVNVRLEFDRSAATGYRLDLPAGASVRWAPGELRSVDLVAIAGTAGVGAGAGDAGPAVPS